ncbi:uncharacterized protein PRCAT00000080001 [Priceomyces carsonii]|uniref:uncharacterized protein n=1 Tax=Priceomyces carsonii TaxID=28549 RepID=UPI002ED80AB0|nr:unnamed protein product [Priceomyces carsonii]
MDNKKIKLDLLMFKICTHSGSFHADESLAVYLVKLLPKFKDSQLIRSRKSEDWEASDIVIDVGAKYDGKKFFDHHQREFSETFSSDFKTKLSSAGLIYKHFGKDIIGEVLKTDNQKDIELLYIKIYKEFIEALDANDNGINNYLMEAESSKKFNDRNITLPAMVSKLNPLWNEDLSASAYDSQFLKSSELMGSAFMNVLLGYGKGWLPAKSIVEEAFKDRFEIDKSGEILVLKQFCPWKEHLYAVEKSYNKEGIIKFVLFADSTGSWRVSTVSINSTSFEFRLGLPENIRGLRDDELSKTTGISGCIFVHAAGFIGGATTKEGALKLAKMALSSTT